MAEQNVVQVYQGLVSHHLQQQTVSSADAALEILRRHEPIQSDEQAVLVVDLAKACRTARLALKAQVDTIKRPLRDASAAVDALSKPKLVGWEQGEDRAKDLMGAWNRAKEQRQAAALEQAKAQERAAAEDGPPDEDAPPEGVAFTPPAPTIVRGGSGSMHEQTITKVRVTDIVALAKAAPDLLELRVAEAKRRLSNGPVLGLELYTEKTEVLR